MTAVERADGHTEQIFGYRVADLQGIGARKGQEDSLAIVNAGDADRIRKEGLLFAVFDGMGGMKDGKLASETAVTSIRESFREMDRGKDLARQLKRAVFRASAAVEKVIGGDGGTTAVIGIIYRDRLYFASVGDSYLFLRRDGELNRLNTEHNVCHEEYLASVRSGAPDPESCRRVPEAEALTQFLGRIGMDAADVCIRPLKLKEGDVLLACSDGVGGVLTEEEVLRSLSFKSEKAMCRQIEQEIRIHARQHQDNYTALVVKCDGSAAQTDG